MGMHIRGPIPCANENHDLLAFKAPCRARRAPAMWVYESNINQSGMNTQLQRILVNRSIQSGKRTTGSLHEVHQLFNLTEQGRWFH